MNRDILLSAIVQAMEAPGGSRHSLAEILNWILDRERMNGFVLGNQPTEELERENATLRRMVNEPDATVEIAAERDRAWAQANHYRLQIFELRMAVKNALVSAQQFAANVMIANHNDPDEIIIHKMAAKKLRNEIHEIRAGEKVEDE